MNVDKRIVAVGIFMLIVGVSISGVRVPLLGDMIDEADEAVGSAFDFILMAVSGIMLMMVIGMVMKNRGELITRLLGLALLILGLFILFLLFG